MKATDNDILVGPFVVAWIDVLNMKQELARWQEAFSKDQSFQAAQPHIKKSYGTIEGLRRIFEINARAAKRQIIPQSEVSKQDSHIQEAFRAYSNSDVRIQSFGDTLIVFSEMRSHEDSLLLKDTQLILNGLFAMMIGAFSIGIALRGGIEMGPGLRNERGEIFGPVTAAAYHLENTVAEYPRIVVGEQMIAVLDGAISNPGSDLLSALTSKDSSLARSMIGKDSDGINHLDYLGKSALAVAEVVPAVVPDLVSKVHLGQRWINASLSRFKEEGNTKLVSRYERLSRYYSERVSHWRVASE